MAQQSFTWTTTSVTAAATITPMMKSDGNATFADRERTLLAESGNTLFIKE